MFDSILPFSIPVQEKDQKYSLRTDEMRVKDVEAGRFSLGKKFAFALFYNNGKWVMAALGNYKLYDTSLLYSTVCSVFLESVLLHNF